jgi:hypothetical protein
MALAAVRVLPVDSLGNENKWSIGTYNTQINTRWLRRCKKRPQAGLVLVRCR